MRLGLRVLEIMNQKNLKMADLASYLNTNPSTISGWKQQNRNPSSEAILPICKFLDVSPTYLYTGKNDINTDLTSEENQILLLYNQLSYADQRELLGIFKGFAIARGITDMELQDQQVIHRREA